MSIDFEPLQSDVTETVHAVSINRGGQSSVQLTQVSDSHGVPKYLNEALYVTLTLSQLEDLCNQLNPLREVEIADLRTRLSEFESEAAMERWGNK